MDGTERVQRDVTYWLCELRPETTRHPDGAFEFWQGSAQIFVQVEPFGSHRVAHIYSYTNLQVPPAPTLFEYLALNADHLPFGHIATRYDDAGTLSISISCRILGDQLYFAELEQALDWVAKVADEIDDDIHERFGGVLAADRVIAIFVERCPVVDQLTEVLRALASRAGYMDTLALHAAHGYVESRLRDDIFESLANADVPTAKEVPPRRFDVVVDGTPVEIKQLLTINTRGRPWGPVGSPQCDKQRGLDADRAKFLGSGGVQVVSLLHLEAGTHAKYAGTNAYGNQAGEELRSSAMEVIRIWATEWAQPPSSCFEIVRFPLGTSTWRNLAHEKCSATFAMDIAVIEVAPRGVE